MTGRQIERLATEPATLMLMVVDVGNTNTVIGIMDRPVAPYEPVASWRFASVRDRTADEWYALTAPLLADHPGIAGMIVSSVVPAITNALVDFGRTRLGVEPMLVSAALDLGIAIRTDNPAEVGTDRLVNCAYAFAQFGGPTIVVDLGTATKIEAITASGDYLGGVIAPGLGLTLDALASRAARLYAVELKLPPSAVGRNTVAAVQSGVVGGHVAMIEGMVARVSQELGGARHVVLTGGYSRFLAGEIPSVTDYQPDLTLRGLGFLNVRNSEN